MICRCALLEYLEAWVVHDIGEKRYVLLVRRTVANGR